MLQEIQLDKGQGQTGFQRSEITATLEMSANGIGKLVTDLALARLEFDVVKKSAENPFYKDGRGRSRKYADLTEMITATAEPLAKHGLVLIQSPIINDRTVGIVTLLAHSSGEWIKSTVIGCPADQKLKEGTRFDAQTIGIGFTYLARYGVRAILNLGSEDDDGNGLVQQPEQKKPAFVPATNVPNNTPAVQGTGLVKGQSTDGDGCPISDEDLPAVGLPTPLELKNIGNKLKALNQDSRLLKTFVETKAGKPWKSIPLTSFDTIIAEIMAANDKGSLKELITPK